MTHLVFKTKRLVMRPLALNDYDVWLRAHLCPGSKKNRWDHGPWKPEECTRAIFKKMLLKQSKLRRVDEYYRYSAFLKDSGELIGHVDFHVYERGVLHFANFGYMLLNPYWGQGLASEMARRALRIGHEHLRLQRLEAAIDPPNDRSRRLARAIGMKKRV